MSTAEARVALERADYETALAALDAAPPDDADTPVWLELRARAAYGAGQFDAAVDTWGQLHRHHRERGETEDAARAAVMTAMFLLIDSGLMSTVRGWVRRAERLLDGQPTGTIHALAAAVNAYERFFCGDLESARGCAAAAVELGERLDVMAAVAIGRTALGRIAILDGDVEAGLTLLDEVAALLMSGDVDPLTTGMMYCELVCAAQGLARSDRAHEWTEAMRRWCPDRAFGGIQGRCRVHQAELLRASGPGDEAERVALQACAELRPWMRREFGWPLVELGNIRLRRGDLAGAEESFLAANDHGWPPHPGLALVRLEQGDADTAADLIAASIAHPCEAPSKEAPPFGDLRMAPLLDAQAEIAAARRDVTTLAAAADALAVIGRRYESPALLACADLAAARLALATGDVPSVLAAARAAVTGYASLGAAFDVGRARVVLAEAHELAGDGDAARLELTSARRAYEKYGASRRAAGIAARLVEEAHTQTSELEGPDRQGTFRRDGPTWEVDLAGVEARVKDLKGVRYLHRLVAEPGREFHVLDLVAVENATLAPGGTDGAGAVPERRGEAGVPALDDEARAAYRRRLAEVDEDIEEATRLNDPGRLAKAEADRGYLVTELTRAVGLGGRTRVTGSSSERARSSVARSLRYALAEIARHHPAFADHLRASVRTGTYCSYEPDPFARVEWEL